MAHLRVATAAGASCMEGPFAALPLGRLRLSARRGEPTRFADGVAHPHAVSSVAAGGTIVAGHLVRRPPGSGAGRQRRARPIDEWGGSQAAPWHADRNMIASFCCLFKCRCRSRTPAPAATAAVPLAGPGEQIGGIVPAPAYVLLRLLRMFDPAHPQCLANLPRGVSAALGLRAAADFAGNRWRSAPRAACKRARHGAARMRAGTRAAVGAPVQARVHAAAAPSLNRRLEL
jgi:hypothetical protein